MDNLTKSLNNMEVSVGLNGLENDMDKLNIHSVKLFTPKVKNGNPYNRPKCRQKKVTKQKNLFENRVHAYQIIGPGDYLWNGFRYH